MLEEMHARLSSSKFTCSFNLAVIASNNGPKVVATVPSRMGKFTQLACFAQSLKLTAHDFLGKHKAIKGMSSEEEKCYVLLLFNHQKSKSFGHSTSFTAHNTFFRTCRS